MAQTTTRNSKLFLQPSQIRKIFDLSNYLADLAEELLEEGAQYSREFIKGLKKSEQDFKKSRVRKIKSLSELS